MKNIQPVYLSARWQRREEMRKHAEALRKLDIHVGCRWLDPKYDRYMGKEPSEEVFAEAAIEDYEDVMRCGLLLAFTEFGGIASSGGRHVETGMAVAFGKPVMVVGPKENVFHRLPFPAIIDVVPNFETACVRLASMRFSGASAGGRDGDEAA